MGFDGAQSNLNSTNVECNSDSLSELSKTCTASESGFIFTGLSESAEVGESESVLIMLGKKALFLALTVIFGPHRYIFPVHKIELLKCIKMSHIRHINIHSLFPIDIFVSSIQNSNDVSEWTNNKKPVDEEDIVNAPDSKK